MTIGRRYQHHLISIEGPNHNMETNDIMNQLPLCIEKHMRGVTNCQLAGN